MRHDVLGCPNAPGPDAPSAGFARATFWGEVRQGGEAPRRRKLVGTGERPEDLAAFDPEAFVGALVGT